MARPTKTLQEHLRDGSFRADRCADLLLGPLVDDEELAGLQATYRMAASTDEQRLVAIAFAQEAKHHEGRRPRPILNGRDDGAVELAWPAAACRGGSVSLISHAMHTGCPPLFYMGGYGDPLGSTTNGLSKPPAESSRSPRRSFTTPRRGGGALGDARGRCVGGI